MRPIIRVNNLSKKYSIGVGRPAYSTVRDSIAGAARASLNWFRRNGNSKDNEVWALKDVSFEVVQGEVVGIIGRNGAGKSTLLKVLSRITEPTTGQLDLYGRVGSLLEVGTGFHAELTGRENIYLNGAILGMKRKEIDSKFDEIVSFAEVEKFLDTPVKHYSSGMYVRLAFAVAAHLETEILVVDEVLAVGDSNFTKKCLGKMSEVSSQGRTVLFVSHSMAAIQNLCQTGIVMGAGMVQFRGPIDQAIKVYLTNDDAMVGLCDLTSIEQRSGSGDMRLVNFWIEDDTGMKVATVPSGNTCSMVFEYVSSDDLPRRDVFLGIQINTLTGAPVSVINTNLLGQDFKVAPPSGQIRFEIPKLPLTAGRYIVDLHLATHGGYTTADMIKGAVAFDVNDGDFYGSGQAGSRSAPMLIDGAWRLEGVR